MRILHICAYTWEAGGPAKVIYDHAQVALRHGHSVTILSPVSPGEQPYALPDGARLVLCRRTPGVSRLFREFSGELYRYLQRHLSQYDVVHCHGLWHFGTLAPFWLDRRVAKVVTPHGVLEPWAYAHHGWKKRLMDALAQKAYLRRADLIQALSTDEQTDILRYVGHHPSHVAVIPNGIRLADFAQPPAAGTFRQRFGVPADHQMVLFMSRLNGKKGLDLLLPAFRDYQRTHPATVLVLAGPDDGYEATVRQFIRQHGLDQSIRLVGMLTGDDKRAALADADVFTLPSYSEGFSMAVLEAMAAGTPALVSDRVGFGDVIRETNAAVLTDLTADGVRAGLTALLGDAALRQRVRQNATALVRARYDLDIVANQLLNAYAAVLKPGR